MTPSRDLLSHHIQRHSTKYTICTYLLPCSWRLTFSIYQIPFIYYWESVFLHRIVKKRTGYYPLSSYRSFNSYPSTSRLLGLDFSSSGSVGIWITPQSFAIDEGLQNRTSLGWRLRWENVTLLQSVGARP